MRCLRVIVQPDSSLSARKTFRRFGRPNQCTPSPRPIIFSVYDESSRTVIIISSLLPRRSVCVHLCRGYLLSVSLARGFGTRRSEAWRRIFEIDLGLSSRWNIVLVCRTVSQCRAASSRRHPGVRETRSHLSCDAPGETNRVSRVPRKIRWNFSGEIERLWSSRSSREPFGTLSFRVVIDDSLSLCCSSMLSFVDHSLLSFTNSLTVARLSFDYSLAIVSLASIF